MEFTYEKVNSRGKTMRKTIEVTPTLDDYLDFIEQQADNDSNAPWEKQTADKVRKCIKWLFDNDYLLEENFDEDDNFRDYLYDSYRDSVEWEYEIDNEGREY